MEEKILRAVSEVTGVDVDDIKSIRGDTKTARARMMYYYLCNDKGLLFEPVARLVNRTAAAASYGAASFAIFIRGNEMYDGFAKDAKSLLLGMKMGDSADWIYHNGHEYIYVRGVKYSIHDVSSRYFGECYVGMVDGNFALYNEDREKAVKGLINMIDNGI